MPIYTYRAKDATKSCSYCRNEFETFQSIRDNALEKCPECGSEIVRLMHGVTTMQDKSTKKILSDENLRKHGFKKLVNTGGGKFDEAV